MIRSKPKQDTVRCPGNVFDKVEESYDRSVHGRRWGILQESYTRTGDEGTDRWTRGRTERDDIVVNGQGPTRIVLTFTRKIHTCIHKSIL